MHDSDGVITTGRVYWALVQVTAGFSGQFLKTGIRDVATL